MKLNSRDCHIWRILQSAAKYEIPYSSFLLLFCFSGVLLIGGATYGGYVLYQKYKTPKEEDVDELATGQTSLDMREFV